MNLKPITEAEIATEMERQSAPTGVAQVLTPSGLEIYYQSGPKRLYRIRESAFYKGEWQEVPSATKVLDVLPKPLQWWGMEVGVRGVETLIKDGYIFQPDGRECLWDMVEDIPATPERIVELLTQQKLTVNHDTGATTKGTNVHKALESFAETGITPDPRFYPEVERGFIQALVNFINDAHPHTLYSELMVGSTDGWAGRLDWVANLDFAGKVVTKTYQKKEPIRTQLSGSWIIDAKTSSEKPGKPKNVYESYHVQGRTYEKGFTECGYGAVDHVGTLRLTNDGRYELVESTATYEDFLCAKDLYHRLERIKGK